MLLFTYILNRWAQSRHILHVALRDVKSVRKSRIVPMAITGPKDTEAGFTSTSMPLLGRVHCQLKRACQVSTYLHVVQPDRLLGAQALLRWCGLTLVMVIGKKLDVLYLRRDSSCLLPGVVAHWLNFGYL